MPQNLFGRIVVRVLAVEWWTVQALLLTIGAVTAGLTRWWGLAALAGLAAGGTWGYVVRDEARSRREEGGP